VPPLIPEGQPYPAEVPTLLPTLAYPKCLPFFQVSEIFEEKEIKNLGKILTKFVGK
jgi:hypothetical protein